MRWVGIQTEGVRSDRKERDLILSLRFGFGVFLLFGFLFLCFFFFVIGGFGSDLCESETDLWQFSLSYVVLLFNFDVVVGFGWWVFVVNLF